MIWLPDFLIVSSVVDFEGDGSSFQVTSTHKCMGINSAQHVTHKVYGGHQLLQSISAEIKRSIRMRSKLKLGISGNIMRFSELLVTKLCSS